MTKRSSSDKLHINAKGFLVCPNCKRNQRLQEITPGMILYNAPLFCRDCKTRILVDVVDGEAYIHSECPERNSPETEQ